MASACGQHSWQEPWPARHEQGTLADQQRPTASNQNMQQVLTARFDTTCYCLFTFSWRGWWAVPYKPSGVVLSKMRQSLATNQEPLNSITREQCTCNIRFTPDYSGRKNSQLRKKPSVPSPSEHYITFSYFLGASVLLYWSLTHLLRSWTLPSCDVPACRD